jgi:hypothetical protein
MLWRRFLCLFGCHYWGRWIVIRDGDTRSPIYRQRQCLICGVYDSENLDPIFNY